MKTSNRNTSMIPVLTLGTSPGQMRRVASIVVSTLLIAASASAQVDVSWRTIGGGPMHKRLETLTRQSELIVVGRCVANENADGQSLVFGFGAPNQGKVPFMERPHGGHQSHRVGRFSAGFRHFTRFFNYTHERLRFFIVVD